MKKLLPIIGIALVFPALVFGAAITTSTADSGQTLAASSTVAVEDTAASSTDVITASSTTQTVAASTTPDASTASTNPMTTTTGSSTRTLADQISALEDAYYQSTGHYLQVLPGNILPSYETGSVSADLGSAIPAAARVDIYDAPSGQGYQISYQDSTTQHSVGYGPEAISRTFSSPLPLAAAATSTVADSTSTVTTSMISASTSSPVDTASSSPADTGQSASTTSDLGVSNVILKAAV